MHIVWRGIHSVLAPRSQMLMLMLSVYSVADPVSTSQNALRGGDRGFITIDDGQFHEIKDYGFIQATME